MGAPMHRGLWGLVREFIILVAVANLIAIPLVLWIWQQVIQTGLLFIVPIGPSMILMGMSISLAAALLAIVSQTFRAARANPVDALRFE